ncbi:MAG: hypothetical protein WCI19_05825 [Betaproteobacteria bacterium]
MNIPAITINVERSVRILGRLLVVALVLLLAWRGAGWAWYFAAPAAHPLIPDLRGGVSLANATRFPWFGTLAQAPVAAPVSDIKVIGLFAGGKRPMALLSIGSQNPVAAVVGESPVPGLQLVEVAGDYAVIARNGINEKVMLTGSGAATQAKKSKKKEGQSE